MILFMVVILGKNAFRQKSEADCTGQKWREASPHLLITATFVNYPSHVKEQKKSWKSPTHHKNHSI